MYDMTVLELMRQRQEQLERSAARARLVREARRSPRRVSRTER